jgi:hypothetical protein
MGPLGSESCFANHHLTPQRCARIGTGATGSSLGSLRCMCGPFDRACKDICHTDIEALHSGLWQLRKWLSAVWAI